MQKIIPNDLKIIGEGGEGIVYRLNDEQTLKVYKNASLESVEQWFRTINSAIDYGISSAKAYEIVEVGERYGIIFDYLNAKSVGRTIASNPECLEQYAEKMGKFLKQLHTTEDTYDLLENVDERMQRVYEKGCKRNIYPDNVADKLQDVLNAIPPRITLVHGDFHEGNIVVRNGELVCIDLDRIGSGHPIYDLMGLYLNHNLPIKKKSDFIMHSWGITIEQAYQVKQIMMRTYYGITDERLLKEYESIVSKAFLFRRLLLAVSPIFNMDDARAREYVKGVVPEFLSVADELPDMINSLPI